MCMPPSRGPGHQPRSRRWAFAVVTAELVRTAVELANHQLEVAQLRQALASRVWIEQAKGMVAATEGITLDQAFHQLRGRARSSSRKLAEVAQELVQDVQRERVAAKALDDARVRAAEARAREAEQALQAAQTGLARRTAALTETKMSWPRASEPLTSATTSPMSGTGPLMTATISPTLASGPPMYATGSPTNPSSGRVEGAAGTNELGSVRTVPPPAGAAVQRRHQEVGPPHAPSATAPSCSWATSNASQGTEGGPLARFAIQEVIDHQVVRAIWTDERLTCDRLLVLGPGCWSTWSAEFHSDDPPRRYHASPTSRWRSGRAAATGAERLRPPPHGALAALYHPWPGAGAVQRRARAWPLHRAAVRVLDGNLVAAAGLPEPVDEPVGHWSPGVRTRISALRPVRCA